MLDLELTPLKGGETIEILKKKTLLHILVRAEAERCGIHAQAEEIQNMANWFRARFNLFSQQETRQWFAYAEIGAAEFQELMTDLVVLAKVQAHYSQAIEDRLPKQLALATVRQWAVEKQPMPG